MDYQEIFEVNEKRRAQLEHLVSDSVVDRRAQLEHLVSDPISG